MNWYTNPFFFPHLKQQLVICGFCMYLRFPTAVFSITPTSIFRWFLILYITIVLLGFWECTDFPILSNKSCNSKYAASLSNPSKIYVLLWIRSVHLQRENYQQCWHHHLILLSLFNVSRDENWVMKDWILSLLLE